MHTILTRNGKVIRVEDDPQQILRERLENYDITISISSSELRNYRNSLLSQSDWMVTKANEEGTEVPNDWKTYRQSLRNLPAHERAPNKFMIADWPLSPDETEVPEQSKSFIAELYDPVGLGTTSWVGITTTGEYYDQTPEPEPIPEEEPEPEEETPPASPE